MVKKIVLLVTSAFILACSAQAQQNQEEQPLPTIRLVIVNYPGVGIGRVDVITNDWKILDNGVILWRDKYGLHFWHGDYAFEPAKAGQV